MKLLRYEDGRRSTGWLKNVRTYLIEPLSIESLSQSLPDVSVNNSHQTLSDFSNELKLPTELLIEQFNKAGITNLKPEEIITDHHKTTLLDFLRKEHGTGASSKIRLTRNLDVRKKELFYMKMTLH